MNNAHDSGLFLCCKTGPWLCAFPVGCVVETLRPLPVEPYAGMPSFVRGMSIIRGSPIPVVHGAALLGVKDAASPSRFVILRLGERRLALTVDAVTGIQPFAVVAGDAPAPLTGLLDSEILSTLNEFDPGLMTLLQMARLVPELVEGRK